MLKWKCKWTTNVEVEVKKEGQGEEESSRKIVLFYLLYKFSK